MSFVYIRETMCFFFFSSRRRHTRYWRDWSSDVCSSDLGVGHTSMVYMIESQVAYVDDALRTMDRERLEVLETTPEAQEAWRSLIARKSQGTVWLAGGCASWYLDRHGHNSTLWPGFTFRLDRKSVQSGKC